MPWTAAAPGAAAATLLAAAAWWIGGLIPLAGPAVAALVLGVAAGMVSGRPALLQPGVAFVLKRGLRVAIVLFGAGLSFAQVVSLSGGSLAVILATVVLAIGLTALFGRWLSAPARLVGLIGVGTAICGATAIVTVGPLIDATEEETAFALGTIFLFNMLAVIVYPLLGHLLGASDLVFGVWAGTAIHDTSSVLAAAYTYSDRAGESATVVKLTRTLLLVPLALLIGARRAARARRAEGTARSGVPLLALFPWFVLWFVGAAALNTLGVLSPGVVRAAGLAGRALIVVVMAAVGLAADFALLRRVGLRPALIGLFASLVIATVSFLLIRIWIG
ncbi:MAG TPA: putative sulfate exporter family transporter [bacterium]|nr:putative sulfate exporter family transporter [bacterium]